ncbi:MAG: ABC transporter ATP-binding protein [Acidimicrobiales bacterium]
MTPPPEPQIPIDGRSPAAAPADRPPPPEPQIPTNGPRPPGWIRRLLPFLRPYRRNVALAFVGALVGSAIAALSPAVERQIVDNVIVHHRSSLWPWLLLLVAAGVARFGAAYVRRFLGGRVSLDVQNDLRTHIFDQLQRLDFARHDEMQTGQLVSRASSDVGLVQGLLAFLPLMAGNVLLVAASLVIMLIYSPLLTAVTLLVIPLLGAVTLRMRNVVFPAAWDAQQQEGVVAGVVDEAVTGVRVVKGFGQEDREVGRLVAAAERLFRSKVRFVRLQARFQPLQQSLPSFGQVAVIALGGWLAIRHDITLGTFVAFATYLGGMVAPARMLSNLLTVGQQARAGAVRIFELLDSVPLVGETPGASPLPPSAGDVRFERVTFGYLRSEPVLVDFDLHLAPGETVALVGASGSGKSTGALLLPRFYDVQGGAVRIDGVDVRDVTLASLRRQIGMVFEESFLFSESIRANIAFGRPDATQEEIEAAARVAEAHAFISALSDGYDTTVGERGLTLSGGQRQRIALARAVLTDPRILILDDATSAVDSKIEEEIHATLRKVMQGRTTLLVAHRRSTLHLADRIAIVDHGRVVDQGRHQELLARSALYRLLLAGPGGDAEGTPAAAGTPATEGTPAASNGADGGVTPAAWPEVAETVGRVVGPDVPRIALGAGLKGMGGHHGWMAGMAATPELLAKVEALRLAEDEPDVDTAAEARHDDDFRLWRFSRPYRAGLALGMVLVVLDALATIVGPVLVRSGIDNGIEKGASSALFLAAGLFLFVTVADLVISMAQTFITGRTSERMLLALRVRIFAQLQRLSIDFYDREMAGRIMTRMTTDIDAFSDLLEQGLITAIVSLLTFVGVAIVMLNMNWRLGLALLAVLAPLIVATIVYRRLSSRAYRAARDRIAIVNANLQENLSGVRESQAFVREEQNESHFRTLASSYLDARVRAQWLVSLYFPFVEFLSEIAVAVVFGVGFLLVRSHSLTVGELVAFVLFSDLLFSPIQQLSQVFDSYQQAVASMEKINELMHIQTGVPLPLEPLPVGRITGALALAGVHFSYPGVQAEALRGIDLTIDPRESVALVGETGAGKSTVMKLFARFYDPTKGAVLVDGHDLRQIDLGAYRRQLGYVPQEAFLFAGSIRDNIAYGRQDASDAEVERAARAVGAHDFIAGLAGGYRHVVAERGRSLSAGERQLIALARALLVDPAILLLDEATSNLDLGTEAKVARAMGVVAQGRTSILIAHRLQTARSADRIIVLDGGRVVEQGTHDDLLARQGRYADMWQALSLGDEVEPASVPA